MATAWPHPPLHALLRKRRIEDLFRLHIGQQLEEVGRRSVLGRVRIPDLDDIVCLFRANGETIDHIRRVGDNGPEHGGNGVGEKGLASVLLNDTETVGPAVNVFTIFPKRGDGVPHQEEHALGQGVDLEIVHDVKEGTPGSHGSEILKGPDSPFGFIG